MSSSTKRWQQVKRLVDETLDVPSAERAAYLERSCGGDDALRREVEAFLEREARLGGFLARPLFSLRAAGQDSDTGRRLGAYRLVRRLGSGGMGAVYLAERDDGELRQQVAVKLLKRGLDSEELLRRFQVERQILADLTHPYVARLLDAGTAEDGRPFLVMEYVEGEPIDVYCDGRRLGTRQRVALFRKVCAAVHFAHRNLVVHRDLKPANVLVTADGTPKLLDFGIAKLLDPDPRASGLTTVPGTSPLTYLYASPEQVAGAAITTATDVYALGVVLYKLLTGHHPHPGRRRRESDPVRPSAVVQQCRVVRRAGAGANELTPESVSRVRDGEPRRLVRRLRGDLDNIVLRALQWEPERRFSSAEQLSEDLRRYLEGLPVRSRPDRFLYRTGKFVRRNALGVSAAAVVAALILGFGIVMAVQRQMIARQKSEIEHERDRAEEVTSFVVGFLRSLDPNRAVGAPRTGRQALGAAVEQLGRELADEPETRAALLDAVGGVYRTFAFYEEARPLVEEALRLRLELYGEDHVLTAESLQNLATLERGQGHAEKAERLMRRALAVQRRGFPEGHRDLARGLNNLALFLRAKGELEEAEALARESLAMKEALFGPEHPEVTAPLHTLAAVLRFRGRWEESESFYRRCLELRRRAEDSASPELANVLNGLAGLLVARGEPEAAAPLYEEALEIRRKLFTGDHPRLVSILNNLGRLRILLGEPEAAEALIEEGLAMARRLADGSAPILVKGLAWARLESGNFSACEELARAALGEFRRRGDPRRTAESQSLLGGCLAGLERFEEAESLLLEGYRGLLDVQGEEAPETRRAHQRLVAAFEAWGTPSPQPDGESHDKSP